MRLIMNEILIMNLGGVIVNQHYLHTLLHNVIESYYDPPKFIMSISFITSLIITLIVFQCGQTPGLREWRTSSSRTSVMGHGGS